MRIATYNIEWFANLFGKDNRPLLDQEWSARRDVTRKQQLEAIAEVIARLDPDALMVVEAPDTRGEQTTEAALLAFAEMFGLRLNRVLTGFINDTQQELALFYDDRQVTAVHDPQGPQDKNDPAPRFDGTFLMDVDVDARPERHVFSKPPLEIALRTAMGTELRLIGVHAKSKAPHGARNRAQEVRISIENRRKQLAQCLWLRRRVDQHLDAGENVIVLGDLNDGPGLDEYEKLFGRSGVEVVLGPTTPADRALFDPHAAARLDPRDAWSPSTARFYLHRRKTYLNALLDFIMVSDKLRQSASPNWMIWHPFDHQSCFADDSLQRALLTASDHFPVSVDLAI